MRLAAETGAWPRRWLATLSCFFLLPAVPMWFISWRYAVDRPLFSLDAIAAAVLMHFMPRVGLMLLAVVWASDLTVSFSAIYHFTRPTDFLAGAAQLGNVDVSGFASISVVLGMLPFVASTALMLRLRGEAVSWGLVAVLSVVLVVVDGLNGSSALSQRVTRILPYNIAGSSLNTLRAQWFERGSSGTIFSLESSETVSATVDIERWARHNPDRSVVFVMVESFGLALDASSRRWMEQRLLGEDPSEYRLLVDTSPFRGATTSGELRQLCALGGQYAALTSQNASGCLPRRLTGLGWTTVGLHGFSKKMFDRERWWPLIGLSELHFGDDSALSSLNRCGAAFRGVCDESMMRLAFEQAKSSRRFVYLLSLNTHLPLQQQTVPEDLQAMCTRRQVPADACQLLAGVVVVLDAVREEARKVPVKPLVLIVGDHAPPFASRELRGLFDQARVPVMALVPADAVVPP